MRTQFSRGETARLYFDIIAAGAGVTGLAPRIAIQRTSDGTFFQASDSTWQATLVENDMTETSSVRLPGRYHFDFDQSLDEVEGSVSYIVKKISDAGTNALEYEDVYFGSIPATVAPDLCSIEGTLLSGVGDPLYPEMVRATLVPVFKDATGRGYQANATYTTFTNPDGDFQLGLVQGGTFRLEIPAVGYDKKITVPSQVSTLFTDL